MVQRLNNFYNTNGITNKSTHIHVCYSRPDIALTTLNRFCFKL